MPSTAATARPPPPRRAPSAVAPRAPTAPASSKRRPRRGAGGPPVAVALCGCRRRTSGGQWSCLCMRASTQPLRRKPFEPTQARSCRHSRLRRLRHPFGWTTGSSCSKCSICSSCRSCSSSCSSSAGSPPILPVVEAVVGAVVEAPPWGGYSRDGLAELELRVQQAATREAKVLGKRRLKAYHQGLTQLEDDVVAAVAANIQQLDFLEVGSLHRTSTATLRCHEVQAYGFPLGKTTATDRRETRLGISQSAVGRLLARKVLAVVIGVASP
mmetsp:Transcript_81800/g.215789  ORF Transcript_81800/g.215789 Transcript_81800/m.215789 type:complete len:270 (-) Transcript_81800:61-870(-)